MESFFKSNPEIAQFSAMLDFIEENYAENLCVERIAFAGGVCRSKCFFLFKKFKNLTPNEYLNDFRLQIGAEMLCSSQNSILHISEECGFNSQSYFSRLFLKKYGMTPIAYRKQKYLTDMSVRINSQKSLFDAINRLSYNFYKIIKINLNNDSYTIVKPDANDKPSSVFSKKYLKGWINEFASNGKIYEEDKAEFLKIANLEYARTFFSKNHNKFSKIAYSYRRKLNNEYRWAKLEIVPDENFSQKNQNVFLYIKDIDDEMSESEKVWKKRHIFDFS